MARHDREIVAVRLQNASLDDKGDGTIVAHGWLELRDLLELKVGDYQREILTQHNRGKKSPLVNAIERGERIPDILLGMRGERFSTRGKNFELEDPVYIVDGLQRVSHLRKFATENPERAGEVRIGAEVRFNTTRDTEKELFTALNLHRTKMSPNVILRNSREDSNGLLTIYGLSHNDASFALYGRVCWNQKMTRNELLTATTYCKVVMALHRGAGAGSNLSNIQYIPSGLQRAVDSIGVQALRDNTYRFFEVIDEVWGIKGVKYVDITTHLRGNFMIKLAQLMTNHENFWDDKRLVVDAKLRAKLKSFPLQDPNIQKLAAAGGTASDLLYRLLVDHFNKGQRINHLVERTMPDAKSLAGKQRNRKRLRDKNGRLQGSVKVANV